MTTPPCTECKNCTMKEEDQISVWYWCEFDECWLSEDYALSDLECDAFEQKLDGNKTEESRA